MQSMSVLVNTLADALAALIAEITPRSPVIPPPVPRNCLAQELPPGSAVEFSHHFFYRGIGFFMVLVDAGQLFRCAGQHCVAMGPPIMGGPYQSVTGAHTP